MADAVASGVTSRCSNGWSSRASASTSRRCLGSCATPACSRCSRPSPGASHEAVEAAIRAEVGRVAEEGSPRTSSNAPRPRSKRTPPTTGIRRPRSRRRSPRRCRRRRGAFTSTTRSASARRPRRRRPGRARVVPRRRRLGRLVRAERRSRGGRRHPTVAPQRALPRPCGYRTQLAPPVRDLGLPGGARLLLLPRHANPTVHLQGSLLAGHGLVAQERWSAASLLPDMLERGTSAYSRSSSRARWRTAASSCRCRRRLQPVRVSLASRCLARHWRLTLELAVGCCAGRRSRPTSSRSSASCGSASLPSRRRTRSCARSRRSPASSTRPATRTSAGRSRATPGARGLPGGRPRGAARELYGPASLVLAVVGDFEPDELTGFLGELLAVAGGRATPPVLPRRTAADATPDEVRVPMADKPNLDVVLGHPAGCGAPTGTSSPRSSATRCSATRRCRRGSVGACATARG